MADSRDMSSELDGGWMPRDLEEARSAVEALQAQLADTERGLAASERRFGLVYDEGPVGVLITGMDGQIVRANPALCQMLTSSETELRGRSVDALIHPDEQPISEIAATQLVENDAPSVAFERRLVRDDGSEVHLLLYTMLQDSSIVGFTYLFTLCVDVTVANKLTAELRHRALHDELTGLANRALLRDRLSGALTRHRDGLVSLSVLAVDLDRFSTINETLGHSVGDEVLRTVAARIDAVTGNDSVGRLGGTTFIVAREDPPDHNTTGALASALHDAIAAPISVTGSEVVITACVGIAEADATTNEPEALLQAADAAARHAKTSTRGSTAHFDLKSRRAVTERVELERDLRGALESGQLYLHYQPKVHLNDLSSAGCEALVRWRHPERGDVSPAEFIPIAEESGMIVDLGRQVIDMAARQAAEWGCGRPGSQMPSIAVNVSAGQMNDDVAGVLGRALSRYEVAPEGLHVELTESMLVADHDKATEFIQSLRDVGVEVGMDDFGTGYSSLSYLQDLPLNFLKIDRAFVSRLGEDASAAAIAAAVVHMGGALDMVVIAEGIETTAQSDILAHLGADVGQGYLFGRPKLAIDLTDETLDAAAQPSTTAGSDAYDLSAAQHRA